MMQTVELTPDQRRALLSALKAGQVITYRSDPPGVFYISGLDIQFRVGPIPGAEPVQA